MSAPNGYLELLLRSILDGMADLRQSHERLREQLHTNRETVIAHLAELETRILTTFLSSSTKRQDPTGEPWKIFDRVLSTGSNMWSAIQWIWHAVIWLVPGVLAGWGGMEAWTAIVLRWLRVPSP
jgi:hypothetical protein